MVRIVVSHTLPDKLIKKIENIRDTKYPGASRSFVIEQLLRQAVKSDIEISVAK